MNKLLYITDLDGTLLNSKTKLSSYSETKMINLTNNRGAILSLKRFLEMQDFYTIVFGDQPIDIPMLLTFKILFLK